MIIHVARRRFATRGFDRTTLTAVAADAEITTPALYHYVPTKAALFEMVFDSTLHKTWDAVLDALRSSDAENTFAGRVAALITSIAELDFPDGKSFLATTPIEVLRHPEFQPLMLRREHMRDVVLRETVEPLRQRLGGTVLASHDDAFNLIRLAFGGWALESFFQPTMQDANSAAFLNIARLLDATTEARASTPRPSSTRTRRTPRSGPGSVERGGTST